jgi:hypothetical protein
MFVVERNYARHLFPSWLSAEVGRWALASELEVNDLFRAGEGRFVGDGDPFPVDYNPEVGVGSVPYPPDFDKMVSLYSFHNFFNRA